MVPTQTPTPTSIEVIARDPQMLSVLLIIVIFSLLFGFTLALFLNTRKKDL